MSKAAWWGLAVAWLVSIGLWFLSPYKYLDSVNRVHRLTGQSETLLRRPTDETIRYPNGLEATVLVGEWRPNR